LNKGIIRVFEDFDDVNNSVNNTGIVVDKKRILRKSLLISSNISEYSPLFLFTVITFS
jgi:hypothetical protein